ncbi:PTS system, beta-glucoside-specific IIB component [Bacillus atrophaeus]|nr:PTS system, beta-glucoside-specific IIB component [Bacillus atrophaeus]
MDGGDKSGSHHSTAIGDGAFYFLPMLLAVSSARKFGSNPYVAAARQTLLL